MPIVILVAWGLLILTTVFPVIIAAMSPLQAGRNPAYIIGGLSGVVALAILLVQPLLIAGYLPGTQRIWERRWHRRLGIGIAVALALHIGGLYLTSPEDMSDALLLIAPTPYSFYGVIGLWAVVLTVMLVLAQKRIGLSYAIWKNIHNVLAVVVVVASVVHTLMIEGAMGAVSKLILCVSILVAAVMVIVHLRVIRPLRKASKGRPV